ncbi:MAG: family 16 glycosylhydrolase [Chlorobi bacterium]|nr:family 16 glycosylhydrolase [Chlorobiota bacterium]
MKTTLLIVLISFLGITGCQQNNSPKTIDLSKSWRFSPDKKNIGISEGWYKIDFDDSQWNTLDAGTRWENQGYPKLDSLAWYRKTVDIPSAWKGKDVWIKFGGVNDAYELYVNGKSVSSFGEANISFAGKPSFTKVSDKLKYGQSNLLVVKVNDWGNSGGLWRLPVIITTDKSETDLFKPLSETPFDPVKEGYKLFWQDEFNGDKLDKTKWFVRGVGPRGVGYITPDAVEVKDGVLKLHAFIENDSLKVGAVGTYGLFETTFGYFECRAKLQKSTGNWAAFWIQSPGISQGEDPAKFGTEIDIFEYFKKQGGDFVSHNLHWAYGPNQQSTGAFLSKVEGVGEGFHTFAVEWTPEKYAFFVDGYKYYEIKQAISHIDEYIILSFEPAHSWEDLKDAVLPDVFIVDYVKVYKKK